MSSPPKIYTGPQLVITFGADEPETTHPSFPESYCPIHAESTKEYPKHEGASLTGGA
jgi:hypothetical protein